MSTVVARIVTVPALPAVVVETRIAPDHVTLTSSAVMLTAPASPRPSVPARIMP